MKIEDAKVGMKVRANEGSNGVYSKTVESAGCGGIIKEVDKHRGITIEVTKHDNTDIVGMIYFDLNPKYFDVVGGGQIKLTLKEKAKEEIKVGDFVLLENGKLVLIGFRGDTYRAIDMESSEITDCWWGMESLIKDIEDTFESSISRVIPPEHIEVIER